MAVFIALDGLDGSGKATQSAILGNYLRKTGKSVHNISFPTYTEPASSLVNFYLQGGLGDDPNDTNAYASSTFFACDRYVSYMTDWKRYIGEDDAYIIADRYTTANAVHQLSKLPEDEWDSFIAWLTDFEFCKLSLPRPDYVIYLEVPPDVSESLIDKRGNKKDIHEKDREYLEKSYRAAKYCAGKLGWISIKCCENGSMRSKEDIFADIRKGLGI